MENSNNDPMPKMNFWGGFNEQDAIKYSNDLEAWKDRNLAKENEKKSLYPEGMSDSEYLARCSWDETCKERDDLKDQVKALSAIKKGLEKSLQDAFNRIKELEGERLFTKEDKWLQGFICAVCTQIKFYDEVNTQTKELFKVGAGNKSLTTLQKGGVDEYDLAILKKYWKELH